MAALDNELFYTLDEEKRELVARGIQIGDGFKMIMQISKKYITGKTEDENNLVNIDIGEVTNVSTTLQRKTTRDYIPGQRDAHSFSKGHVLGNGRMIGTVLDRDIINFIFGDIYKNVPKSKVFDLVETQNTFGAEFEVEEQTETELSQNREELVGGSDIVFSKDKQYIYLDDVPIFTLRFIARADDVKHIQEFGHVAEDGYRTGVIFQRIIKNVRFIGSSSGFNAVDPISNEVIDFAIYGNDTGWKPLK